MSYPIRRALVAASTLFLATAALAQKWRVEKVPSCGIQFDAPSRLERLPMQLGEREVYRRARLRPKDPNDFVRAQYYWYCDVYAFPTKESKDGKVELPEDVPENMKEQLREMLANLGAGERHNSFESWLSKKDNVEILEKAKKTRGKGNNLDYEHWEYLWHNDFGPVGITYCEAAVYRFEDKEVALVIEMPLEKDKPPKPKSKWSNIMKRVMRSGEACEVEDKGIDDDDERNKYADSDAKKEALERAKSNIAGLQGWDYFTMPNYIVLYSWDFEKSSGQNKAKKEAEYYAERLEKMRELYIESYPLDKSGTKAIVPDPSTIPGLGGPVTGSAEEQAKSEEAKRRAAAEARKDEEGVVPYSVFRLCATYEQFQKYGQSPPGVVGWYSPGSKELVVFLGGDTMMGQGATETVTYHEGWHQFADLYFHPPESEQHASLHRWFDEGHGDYFGSFRWSGSRWKYEGSKMRYSDCRQMVRQGDYVPFKDIVRWPRAKFYSGNAPYYYAQAYSMIDFFRRGEKGKEWRKEWGEVLEMYRRVTLVKGDTKMAVDIAFRDWDDDDWKALEDAWKEWVSSSRFLKG